MASLKLNRIRSFFIMGAAAFVLSLAYSCYEAARLLTSEKIEHVSSVNLLVGRRATQIRKLKLRISELEGMLKYMVWPLEKKKIQNELSSLMIEKQNLSPYDARDSQVLLAVQNSQNVPLTERLWAMERAINFNKWNIKRRTPLAYYCIFHNDELIEPLTSSCNRLLGQLPLLDNRIRLAKTIGVDPIRLKLVLQRAGILD